MDRFACSTVENMRLNAYEWQNEHLQFDSDGLLLVHFSLTDIHPFAARRTHARHVLRQLLSQLLDHPVQTLPLHETPHGPRLALPFNSIKISLSYATHRGLIGLSQHQGIGVDIVQVVNFNEMNQVAKSYFSDRRYQLILAQQGLEKDTQFAQAWADIEASSKCLGLPLSEMSPARAQQLNQCELRACTPLTEHRLSVALCRT
jgi:4'-phosphopantetheinyl transferase